jgi:hypothetical protein
MEVVLAVAVAIAVVVVVRWMLIAVLGVMMMAVDSFSRGYDYARLSVLSVSGQTLGLWAACLAQSLVVVVV